jgi:hypothetical protein
MKETQRRIILVCSIAAWLAACSEDATRPTPPQPFSGILVTNTQCQIVGGDATDFQPRPTPGGYSLIACPNPTDKNTWVRFQLPQPDSVWLFVFDRPGSPPIDTLLNQPEPAGSHAILWSHDGPDGVYRVVMGTAIGFESYGDVQFDENWTPSNRPLLPAAPGGGETE